MQRRHKIILDCDNSFGLPGRDVDDGLALLYLLGRPDIELIGVTHAAGNTTVSAAVHCTSRMLERLGYDGIRLGMGWSDGNTDRHETDAAKFLVQSAEQYPGEITVVATGPLANVSAAARMDPGFFGRLARINVMGGRFTRQKVGVVPIGELNFSRHPTAASAVLRAPCPITLFTTEVCLSAPFRWWDLTILRQLDPWVARTVLIWMVCFGTRYLHHAIYLWDVLPAMAVTHPGQFETVPCRLGQQHSSHVSEGYLSLSDGRNINRVRSLRNPARLLQSAASAWRRAAPRVRVMN